MAAATRMEYAQRKHFRKAALHGAVKAVAVCLAGALLAGAAAAAPRRMPTGKLSGVVLGTKGKPAAHAHVILQDADGSHPRAVQTDAAGRFHFPVLHPGIYEVRAQAKGQSSDWEHNVLVRAGQETRLTLRLTPTEPAADQPKKSPDKPTTKRPSS